MTIYSARALAVLYVITALTACASYTPAQVQAQLERWNKTSLENLIGVFGVPAKQYSLDGKRYIEWVKTEQNSSSSRISIGTGTGGRGWFSSLGLSLPLESTPDACAIRATTLEDNNQIIKLDWQGDKDFCGEWLSQLNQEVDSSEK